MTWPNLVTLIRTVAAVELVVLALATSSSALLYIGLAVYWIGDMADGALARYIRAETRTGALFDIVADRLCVAAFYLAYAATHHTMLVPVAVFLFNFMLVDNILSLAFLRWPIMSTNYFYAVNRKLYKLNWSPIGKASNTGLFLVVMLVTRWWPLALVVATAQLALKIYSTVLLSRLPDPAKHTGCVYRDIVNPTVKTANPHPA